MVGVLLILTLEPGDILFREDDDFGNIEVLVATDLLVLVFALGIIYMPLSSCMLTKEQIPTTWSCEDTCISMIL